MTFSAIFVLVVLIAMFLVLVFDKMRPGLTLFCAAVLIMSFGIITPSELVSGFSNTGMLTVALLFLVSEGIRQTGALNGVITSLLPNKKSSISKILARLLPSIAAFSAFLNNTAVVVIFAPIIKRWADNMNISATKFLIPLSYATILGGVCTLIGTSTNLVVDGMMQDNGYVGFTLFELGKVGIFITILGLIYLIFFSKYLLPGMRGAARNQESQKEYYYIVRILPSSKLIGLTNKNPEVGNILPDMVIVNIKRKGECLDNSIPIVLQEGDTLLVGGSVSSTYKLFASKDVRLTCLEKVQSNFKAEEVTQAEVVLAPRFPGLKSTLGEFDFYRHYGALVLSVHRNGESLNGDLDELVLQEGDNLVLLTNSSFLKTWGKSSVFYLVTEDNDYVAPSSTVKRYLAAILVLLMVIGAVFGENINSVDGKPLGMFFFAAVTVFIMAALRIFPDRKYTKFISWDILIAIAAAFAISKAMFNSGIADEIATLLIDISAGANPHVVLMIMYIITAMCTELITNNAAAALMFPIALSISNQLGVNPYPFFVTICVAASASFMTPIGYQTNLIVQSIGNYKFTDYWKVGAPLAVIVFVVTVLLVPLFWAF
ncbi:MAG: SLC13 family permease [Rikenellaceae bacterium]